MNISHLLHLRLHPWKTLLSFLVFSLVVYGGFIEPRWIEVARSQRNLGLSGKAFTIAQISDLHINTLGPTEQKTLERLKTLQPNLILLTGDVIDSQNSLPILREFLSKLPPSIKVAILGNWEHWSGVDLKELAALYADYDVKLLINQCLSLRSFGLPLSIVGFDDYTAGQPEVGRSFKDCGTKEPIIIVEHSPGLFEETPSIDTKNIAFSLAGHTHGGQIAVGNHALITPPGSGKFVAGWYKTLWGDLHVSKGVGTSVLPLRIGARPEISFFEIN
jgi:predicted MPP superfamily phosphohydrolase